MAGEAGSGREGVAGLSQGQLTLACAVAALAAAAVYVPGGAVWDDHTLILGALAPLNGAGLLGLWTQPVGGGEVGTGYYRPLAMTALALLGRIGIPAIHLLAAALHGGSTALLHRLLGDRPGVAPEAAALGALLFAVHPLANEALGWASALPDVMAVHLGLWSVLAASRGGLRLGLAAVLPVAVLLLLGALCKETSLLLLPIAIVGGLVRGSAARVGWLAWGVGVAGALTARLLAGTGAAWSVAGKAALVPGALLWPLGSLAVPWPLTAVRDLLAMPAWSLVAGLAVLGAMALGAVSAGRRPESTGRLAWAGLGLALAAPALALPPTLTGYLAAERYAYPALVGAALWVAAVGSARWLKAGLVLAVLSVGAHGLRAPAWRGDVALFGSAAVRLPGSSYAWHFLGLALARGGDMTGAADALEMAVLTGHPHPQDRLMALKAMLESGDAARAFAWAEAGPAEGLTAEDIAYWAMAAWRAGEADKARSLVGMLRTQGGYAGPPWVTDLAAEMARQAPAP